MHARKILFCIAENNQEIYFWAYVLVAAEQH